MPGTAFVNRIRLRNFRSIRECDVSLGPLTFLVGTNGAGKSNFVDALRFVSDALRTSLEAAVNARGGYNELRRKPGSNTGLEIHLDLSLPGVAPGRRQPRSGSWRLALRPAPPGGFRIDQEECLWDSPFSLRRADGTSVRVEEPHFAVSADGARLWNLPFEAPDPSATKLYLTTASGLPPFGDVEAALRSMSCHNLNPYAMRQPQPPDPGLHLAADGHNLAAMVQRLEAEDPGALERVRAALGAVLPGLDRIARAPAGPQETLRFTMSGAGGKSGPSYYAAQMSDGTLRALGCLVALFGPASSEQVPVRLVALEEPETAVHPGAVRVLLSAIREASRTRQVIVTTHSPDLLDHEDIRTDEIRSVGLVNGETVISEIDEVARDALKEGLYTAGELHRLGQLAPSGHQA